MASKIAQGVANGSVAPHLWFIPMLMGLYLFTPVLRPFVAAASSRGLMYFLVVCVGFAGLVPLANKFVGLDSEYAIKLSLYNQGFGVWIGYYVLGYFLNRHAKVNPWIPGIAFLAGWTIVATGTRHLNSGGGAFDSFFYGPSSPGVVIMAVSAFLLARNIGGVWQRTFKATTVKGIQELGACVFGVYLIHIIIINTFRYGHLGIRLTEYSGGPVVGTLSLSLVGFSVSLGMVYLFRRIAIIRWLVPGTVSERRGNTELCNG